MIVMYAEAGRSRSGELGKPRHGLGRLALESGAPVVPTAIAGTERARNWKRLQFPKVTIQFGEPLRFEQVPEPTKEQAQAASEIVFERVREMHARLVGEGPRGGARSARGTAPDGGLGPPDRFRRRPTTALRGSTRGCVLKTGAR